MYGNLTTGGLTTRYLSRSRLNFRNRLSLINITAQKFACNCQHSTPINSTDSLLNRNSQESKCFQPWWRQGLWRFNPCPTSSWRQDSSRDAFEVPTTRCRINFSQRVVSAVQPSIPIKCYRHLSPSTSWGGRDKWRPGKNWWYSTATVI